jgi:hypothetical protein
MREVASEALTIMAKTSEVTHRRMFPALLHNLENPSPELQNDQRRRNRFVL